MTDYDQALNLYEQGKSAMESGDIDVALEKCLLLKDQHSEAMVCLAAAAGLGLKQFRPRFLLAKAHLAVGEREDAISQLKEALRLNPNYKSASELLKELAVNEEGD